MPISEGNASQDDSTGNNKQTDQPPADTLWFLYPAWVLIFLPLYAIGIWHGLNLCFGRAIPKKDQGEQRPPERPFGEDNSLFILAFKVSNQYVDRFFVTNPPQSINSDLLI